MTTPVEHLIGHVKRDPETGAVAVRTNQPVIPLNPLRTSQAWLVATTTSGPRFVPDDIVSVWPDLYVPGGVGDG